MIPSIINELEKCPTGAIGYIKETKRRKNSLFRIFSNEYISNSISLLFSINRNHAKLCYKDE